MNDFDLEKSMNELNKTYTKRSVDRFIDDYMANARVKSQKSWETFVNNSKILIKKGGYVSENGTPYYPIGYDTFENLEKDGIKLSDEEKLEFEILMAYLIVEKGLDPEDVRELNHKTAKIQNMSFMEAWRRKKALQNPKAKERLKEIYNYYKLEEQTL